MTMLLVVRQLVALRAANHGPQVFLEEAGKLKDLIYVGKGSHDVERED